VAEHPTEKVSALQVVHTSLHSGGKFDNAAYKVSGGLHGVGAAAVNALSEWMEVTVRRDGAVWRQRYERGVPMTPVVRLRNLKKEGRDGHDDDLQGRRDDLHRRPRVPLRDVRQPLPRDGFCHQRRLLSGCATNACRPPAR
jgi:hypothetical protein